MTKPLRTPAWPYYMFREMLGKGLNEKCNQIHLSDGGHFENLGMYELIRRRCKYIIVSDAACDPHFHFQDLGKLIELARLDFGAEVQINVDDLKSKGDDRVSDKAIVQGKIIYDDGETAELIYIKTTITKYLSEDIYSYRRAHDVFPDQTTADQFFDEPQFEAYRELGYLIGSSLFKGKHYQSHNPTDLFT